MPASGEGAGQFVGAAATVSVAFEEVSIEDGGFFGETGKIDADIGRTVSNNWYHFRTDDRPHYSDNIGNKAIQRARIRSVGVWCIVSVQNCAGVLRVIKEIGCIQPRPRD